MLNNDFKDLVKKYAYYKLQKQKRRNRRIVLFLVIIGLGYYLFKTPSLTTTKNNIKESNSTTRTQETNETVLPKKENKLKTPKIENNNTINGLKVTTDKESLEQLLANQAHLKNYSSTIAIANYHYSKKNYPEAIKWSIEASKKNKSKARPWIIYAKSKKALGKEEIAKKALTLFLKRHQSEQVKTLLDSL